MPDAVAYARPSQRRCTARARNALDEARRVAAVAASSLEQQAAVPATDAGGAQVSCLA
jgi:hypothetical protein